MSSVAKIPKPVPLGFSSPNRSMQMGGK